MKLPPFKIKKLIFIKKRVYLIQLILMVNMKKNILLLNVSKKDLQFIDNNEFIVNEVHNIDKQQNIVKDAQVVLVDLEQKDNFKEMFSKNVKPERRKSHLILCGIHGTARSVLDRT